MEKNIITLSTAAIAAIQHLQDTNGTFEFYTSTLDRLFNYVLNQSDEIGMSDTEAVHTLRVLSYLKNDITHIAGKGDSPFEIRIEADMEGVERSIESLFHEEVPEKTETTFAGLTISEVQESKNKVHTVPGDISVSPDTIEKIE